MKCPDKVPYLLYADEKGQIFEDINFYAVGKAAHQIVRLQNTDFIELPLGSELFTLPKRQTFGWHIRKNEIIQYKKGSAVAAFVAPAYTQLYSPAYTTLNEAPLLPLFAYAPVGWYKGKFYTTAIRIDKDIRQDCNQFHQPTIVKNVEKFRKFFPNNRLYEHIAHCATVYLCPAARNFFMQRWEGPLPTSPTCNSRCVGCISYQPQPDELKSPQNRITFVPTPEEIAQIALFHIQHAPKPVVSFGQGCEGEPLLVWQTLRDSIKLIRKQTSNGVINLNTNGSNPKAIEALIEAGLDSIRISLNSFQREIYNVYYNPTNYQFSDLIESAQIMRKAGKWVSVNYFVFPGITDSKREFEHAVDWIKQTQINMIQWRNFNIDPDWYLKILNYQDKEPVMGILQVMKQLKQMYPTLVFGYFNPYHIHP